MGVGWEYGFSPNWTAGVEYDHLFMGHANNSFSATDPRARRCSSTTGSARTWIWSPLRINYRFGGYGSPVVAKYWSNPRPIDA